VQIDADGSAAALRPRDGDADALVQAFAKVPHVKAYRAEDLPTHLHFQGDPRIAPVWVLPDEGWHVESRASFVKLQARYPKGHYLQGDHGYDPARANMRGTFIATGPAFRRGVEIPEVENVHIYNLLCAVLKLTPAPNDGDDRLVKAALRE
jgi:predicted AlkP superfamily pyrophosphatase or phosphodiesterase